MNTDFSAGGQSRIDCFHDRDHEFRVIGNADIRDRETVVLYIFRQEMGVGFQLSGFGQVDKIGDAEFREYSQTFPGFRRILGSGVFAANNIAVEKNIRFFSSKNLFEKACFFMPL